MQVVLVRWLWGWRCLTAPAGRLSPELRLHWGVGACGTWHCLWGGGTLVEQFLLPVAGRVPPAQPAPRTGALARKGKEASQPLGPIPLPLASIRGIDLSLGRLGTL